MVATLLGRRENQFEGKDGNTVFGGILYVSFSESHVEGVATAEIKLYGKNKALYDKISSVKVGQKIDLQYQTLPGSRFSTLIEILPV